MSLKNRLLQMFIIFFVLFVPACNGAQASEKPVEAQRHETLVQTLDRHEKRLGANQELLKSVDSKLDNLILDVHQHMGEK